MSLAEIKAELMRAEYPTLRPDHDPDIERYFEFRGTGKTEAAFAVYQSRLSPRYPDVAQRAQTLRAYRLRDPAYAGLVYSAYTDLGDKLLEHIKRIIKYLSWHAANYDSSDAYSTIKAAESILRMLPKEQFEAVAAIERLRRYADRLGYQENEMERAEGLVRAYLNESLDVVVAERDRRRREQEGKVAETRRRLVEKDKEEMILSLDAAGKRKEEEICRQEALLKRRRGATSTRSAFVALDLSTLRFSAADLSRIQIPPSLVKVEDKALAFCFKYWKFVEDNSFERVVFLYSRKHSSRHYDIFAVIRDGRRRRWRDEEILTTIVSLLCSGYYYSIQGDLYLQRNWVLLKPTLEPPRAQGDRLIPIRQRPGRVPTLLREPVRPKPERLEPARREPARLEPVRREPVLIVPTKVPIMRSMEHSVPHASKKPATMPSSPAAAGSPGIQRPVKPLRPAIVPSLSRDESTDQTQGSSVSDYLRKLSGRSYDVYQDRFLSKVRASIRSVLAERRFGRRAIFASVPQEAEELVYSFLSNNYANPFMSWENSEEKKLLSGFGFELDAVEAIIEHCYRRL